MQTPWSSLIYSRGADFTALASSAAEGTLLAGPGVIPSILPWCLLNPLQAPGKRWKVKAEGVLSTTGTPTLTFQLRLGTTAGAATLSGASVGQSAAITTINNSANAFWSAEFEMVCVTPGVGTNAATLQCHGTVFSQTGFAVPYTYLLVPSIGSPATWTQTADGGLTNFLNLSATWSASSASNTATCKFLTVEEWN